MKRRRFLHALFLFTLFGCGSKDDEREGGEGPPPGRFPPRPVEKKPKPAPKKSA
jgi:hypothetical protein